MKRPEIQIEEILESILRGAAKILNCISANLIIFNSKTKKVQIVIGTVAEKTSEVNMVEAAFGSTFQNIAFNLEELEDSLVFVSWRDRAIHETSSIGELAGSAIAKDVVDRVTAMIGMQRFICVPVSNGRRNFGVIIFTKEDDSPFGLQQREIMLRYAQRIGEIIGNDLRDRGSSSHLENGDLYPDSACVHLFIDEDGELSGHSVIDQSIAELSDFCGKRRGGTAAEAVLEELASRVKEKAIDLLRSDERENCVAYLDACSRDLGSGREGELKIRVEMSKVVLRGERFAFCSLCGERPGSERSIQSQLLHFALGDSTPVLLVDPMFTIASCNDATESLMGYKSEELLQKPIGILFQDDRDIKTILNHKFLFLSNGYYKDVTMVRHKNGSLFPGRIEALLLADEENRVVGYMVLIHDNSTALPEMDAIESINQMIRRERLATMGEMAAGMAHEIRNPLISIGATLEMLKKEEERNGGNGSIMAELADKVARVDTILKDYLSMAASRSTSVAVVEISGLIEEAKEMLMGTPVASGRKVVVEESRGLMALADYDGLKHVFLNLLRNALDAMPEGGTVACRARGTEKEIIVEIDDEGHGLKCSVSQCMKPFFTTKTNGTGMGLSVCEQIMRAHGGMISLRTLIEGGCRATVVLPRKVG